MIDFAPPEKRGLPLADIFLETVAVFTAVVKHCCQIADGSQRFHRAIGLSQLCGFLIMCRDGLDLLQIILAVCNIRIVLDVFYFHIIFSTGG